MTYELSPDLKDKLKTYSKDDAEAIAGAMSIWAWVSDIANSEEQEPIATDDPQIRAAIDSLWAQAESISFLPSDARIIPINLLHKSNAGFSRKTKIELNRALGKLRDVGVVSQPSFLMSTAGHSREVRYLSPLWQVSDNDLAFSKLESSLLDLLLAQVEVTPPQVAAPEAQPAAVYALRILHDMQISFSGATWNQARGSVVEGFQLCEHLKKTGAAVAEISQTDVAQCPNCNTRFSVMDSPERATPPLICLKDLRFWFNGSTILRQKGDLEDDEFLIKHLLETRAAVAWASPSEWAQCPNSKCRRVFKREALLGDLTRMQHLQPQSPAPAQLVAAAPAATATTATSPQPVAPFADPLRQPLSNDLDIHDRLSQRFWPAE